MYIDVEAINEILIYIVVIGMVFTMFYIAHTMSDTSNNTHRNGIIAGLVFAGITLLIIYVTDEDNGMVVIADNKDDIVQQDIQQKTNTIELPKEVTAIIDDIVKNHKEQNNDISITITKEIEVDGKRYEIKQQSDGSIQVNQTD